MHIFPCGMEIRKRDIHLLEILRDSNLETFISLRNVMPKCQGTA